MANRGLFQHRQNVCHCGHRMSVHRPDTVSHGIGGPCLAPVCACNGYECSRPKTEATPARVRRPGRRRAA